MAVFQVSDQTGATFFAAGGADFAEGRKKAVEGFDNLPPLVQKGWVAHWEAEASQDAVTGVDGIALITTFLKESKKRWLTSDAARRQLIVETLSVPLAEATSKSIIVGKGSAKLDLIAAVQKTTGVPYKTLASWAAEVSDKAVLKEIKKRAEAASDTPTAKPAPA